MSNEGLSFPEMTHTPNRYKYILWYKIGILLYNNVVHNNNNN